MSKGIDYSKWDHIDDSDEEEEEEVRGAPRVTRLDTPSRITTAQDGAVHVQAEPSTAVAPRFRINEQESIEPDVAADAPKAAEKNAIPVSWTSNGGSAESHHLYWCQDRYIMWLRMLIPPEVPSNDLTVEWSGKVYAFADRFTAVGSNNTAAFRVHQKSKQLLLIEGDLPHPVHHTEDTDDDEELDWEIDRDGDDQRYLLLTLPKATPMHGMTLQWKRPLQQVPANKSGDGINKTSEFQQAWDEAHSMFKQKIASGEIPKRPENLG